MARPIYDNRKYLYEETDLTVPEIAEKVGISKVTMCLWVNRNYTKEQRKAKRKLAYRKSKLGSNNPMTGKCGTSHHNYKGRVSDGKGYILVLKPEWFTGRKGSKHVFEHHVVYCEAHGMTEIPKGYVIHHVDHDKTNNDPENLIMLTISDHIKLHAAAEGLL
jgi:hypothetical protein